MLFPYFSYFLSFPENFFFFLVCALRCGQIYAQTTPVFHPLLLVTEVSPFASFNFNAAGMCSSHTLHAASPSYH